MSSSSLSFLDFATPDVLYYLQSLPPIVQYYFKTIIYRSPHDVELLFRADQTGEDREAYLRWLSAHGELFTGSVSAVPTAHHPYETHQSAATKILHPAQFQAEMDANPNLKHGKTFEETAAQCYLTLLQADVTKAWTEWKVTHTSSSAGWVYNGVELPYSSQKPPVVTLLSFGLLVDEKYPWRGVSLDRLVCIDNVPVWLLEIKCPGPFRRYQLHPLLPLYYYDQLQCELHLARQHWSFLHTVHFFMYSHSSKESTARSWFIEPFEYNDDYFSSWYFPRECRYVFYYLIPFQAQMWWNKTHPDQLLPISSFQPTVLSSLPIVQQPTPWNVLSTRITVIDPWAITVPFFAHPYMRSVSYGHWPRFTMPYSMTLHVACQNECQTWSDVRWNWKHMMPICMVARIHDANHNTFECLYLPETANATEFHYWLDQEWIRQVCPYLQHCRASTQSCLRFLLTAADEPTTNDHFQLAFGMNELLTDLTYAYRIFCWQSQYVYSVLTAPYSLPHSSSFGHLEWDRQQASKSNHVNIQQSGPFSEEEVIHARQRTFGVYEIMEHQLKQQKSWSKAGLSLHEFLQSPVNQQLLFSKEHTSPWFPYPLLNSCLKHVDRWEDYASWSQHQQWNELWAHIIQDVRMVDVLCEQMFLQSRRIMTFRPQLKTIRWEACQMTMEVV